MANEEKSVETAEEVQTDETSEQGEEQVQAETAEQDLAAELEKAREEAQANKDLLLRAEAEKVNLRRRMEKDVENAHKYGQEKLVKEIVNVADNLERTLAAIETETDEIKPLKEGVEITLNDLKSTFGQFNIEAVDPEGEPFDPQLHQAMSMIENPEVEPNTVINVMQKGYTLNGRLIRPAMVIVSKGNGNGKKIDETA